MSVCCIPDTVLYVGETAVDKKDPVPVLFNKSFMNEWMQELMTTAKGLQGFKGYLQ